MASILKQWQEYDRSWLAGDVVAGATVWAVLVPSALAYASIVGVDPVVGLYTVPAALVAYAFLGGSRSLVVGPDAAISVLAASTVAAVASDTDSYAAVVVGLSLLVGGIYLVMSALRMGWIADLVPEPVLKGFIQGLVVVTVLDQVPSMLGLQIDGVHSDVWRKTIDMVTSLTSIDGPTALVGVGSLVVLFGLKRFVPKAPPPLVALVIAIAAVYFGGLDDEGVAVVGEADGPLFGFGIPSGVSFAEYGSLFGGALAIVVLGFTESMGAAKTAAAEQRASDQLDSEPPSAPDRLDPDRELLALGVSNLGSAFSGGYVVTGALSKTSVAVASGGKSQLANLVAAGLAVLTTLVLRPIFAYLPKAALAAIVIYAMVGMLNLRYFARLYRLNRREWVVAVVAFIGVLTFGVLAGVVCAVLLALVLILVHLGTPRVVELPTAVDETAVEEPAVDETAAGEGTGPHTLVLRLEAPLLFLSVRRFVDEVERQVGPETRVIVLDASATTAIDSTSLEAVSQMVENLRSRGIEFRIARPLGTVWQGIVARFDEAHDDEGMRAYATIADAVEGTRPS